MQWTVTWHPTGQSSLTQSGCLTIDPPLPIRVPILLYHKVGPTVYDADWVTPAAFESHLKALKAYGYDTITLQELMDGRAGLLTLPAKPVLITFDDGFENFVTDAYPILSDPAINFRATNFIITGQVGQTNAWECIPPIINYLTWSQLQTLQAAGLADFPSHTVSHPNLANYPPEALPDQLVVSRQNLEAHLGTTVRFIAWPYGGHNLTVEQAAWAAGYFAGLAATGGVETDCADKWALRRINVHPDISVAYDPGHPNRFLMTAIEEPDLTVPQITVHDIEFFHPVTHHRVTSVRHGEAVHIHVVAANAGPAAAVIASLRIDDDADPANGLIYDSHAYSPAEDLDHFFQPGTHTFQWTVTIPWSAQTGSAAVAVNFHDAHHVLDFARSGWRPGFGITTGRCSVTGTVVLGDYPPGPAGVPVQVKLRHSGGTTTVVASALDSKGRFGLADIAPGTYRVTVKAPHWLAACVDNAAIFGHTDIGTVWLTNGDTNGDNRVGFEDFAVLQNHYRRSGMTGSEGDFNGDRAVTYEDFAILQNHYGQTGAAETP